jgi:hypothetical protein
VELCIYPPPPNIGLHGVDKDFSFFTSLVILYKAGLFSGNALDYIL